MKAQILLAIAVMLGICLSVGGSGAATGDWTYLYDATHSGVSPTPVELPLALSWKYNTHQVSKAVATPAVGPDRVYFAVGQTIYAADRRTGVMDWERQVGTDIASALILHDNTLYFGADDGKLWAIDATTGSAAWKFPAKGPIKSAPLLVDQVLYFGANDKRVYAFDLATDTLRWQFETGGKIQSTPVLWKDFIYVASRDKYLYALRRETGRLAWKHSLESSDVFSSPVIQGGTILIAAGSRLFAIDLSRGQKRWTFTASDLITGTPAVRAQMAFVGTKEGVIYGIDTTRGHAVWRFPEQGSRGEILSSPVLAGDVVLCRTGYPQDTGFPGTVGQQYGGYSAAVGRPGTGYPGTTGGPSATSALKGSTTLLGLSPADGSLLWEYRIPKPPAFAAYTTQQPYGSVGGAPAGAPGAYSGYGAPGAAGPGAPPGVGGRTGARPGAPSTTRWGWAQPRRYEDAIDASPCVSDGELFVIGDDGILYGFGSQAADNVKPIAEEAIIQLEGPQQVQYAYELYSVPAEDFVPPPDSGDLLNLPGAPPIRLSIKVRDEGSGVNPASVKVLIDGQPVSDDQYAYDPQEGMVWWTYDPQGAIARNYPDGQRHLVALVSDWSGNEGGAQLFFVVDNSLTYAQVPNAPQPVGFGAGGGYGPGFGAPGGAPMPGAPGVPAPAPGYGPPMF